MKNIDKINNMIFKQLDVGGYDRNFSYLVADEETKEAVVIDPVGSIEIIEEEAKGFEIKYVINTHSHPDHTELNTYFLSKGAELIDKDFKLGKIDVKIIRTPGHSKDSKCILVENKLISGDTLFVGKIGGGFYSDEEEYESLQKLMKLDDNIEVWPGHDYGVKKHSTIGNEKKTNPFIKCKNYEEFLYLKQHWEEYKLEHGIS